MLHHMSLQLIIFLELHAQSWVSSHVYFYNIQTHLMLFIEYWTGERCNITYRRRQKSMDYSKIFKA